METKFTINELVDKVLSELERLNYAHNSICGFQGFYKRVIISSGACHLSY